MKPRRVFVLAMVSSVLCSTAPAWAQPPGHVTGIGGVIVRSKDPKALSAWYRDVLGLEIAPWGGAKLSYAEPGHPPVAVWAPLPQATDELTPSTRDFMLNLAVDDMDAFVARLTAKGVPILKRDQDAFGKYAWVLDPDGTKIELWQPPPAKP
jgi:catechol 2,3-dioxygenase-like lactoylglutathione lyase family enzyme